MKDAIGGMMSGYIITMMIWGLVPAPLVGIGIGLVVLSLVASFVKEQ